MLKVEINVPEGKLIIAGAGSSADVFADTLTIIHGVYESIREDNPLGAEIYKAQMLTNIAWAFDMNDMLDDETENAPREKTDAEIIREVLDGGIDENE